MQIFIDGAHGTTGLILSDLVSKLGWSVLSSKDDDEKYHLMKKSDISVVCLQDKDVPGSIEIAKSAGIKILDTSRLNRCSDEWIYGLPELNNVWNSNYVSNPGCFATGCLIAILPLLKNGLVFIDDFHQFHGMTGFSAGGKKMINRWQENQLGLLTINDVAHPHIHEIKKHAKLNIEPFLSTSIGNFYSGQIVKYVFKKHDLCIFDIAKIYENAGYPVKKDRNVHIVEKICNDVYVYLQQENDICCVNVTYNNLGRGAATNALENIKKMLCIQK